MGLRVLRGGRRQIGNVSTYVGEFGTVFYDENTGTLRLSDGVTPGGINNVMPIATSTQVGGIKAGAGVNITSEGEITIDAAGLPVGFGDFYAFVDTGPTGANAAWLSSVITNQDIVLSSNGTGSVNVEGKFAVYPTDGPLNTRIPIFTVDSDGQVQMLVPTADSAEGAVTIVGGLDGVYQPPINTGVMLHITGIAGTPGVPSRIYNDSQNAFSAFVARRYNGTAVSPSAVLADEEIMRLSGTAHNGTTIPTSANQRIVYRALGNQTLTNQGGAMEFWTTPLNSTTLTQVATIDNANGFTVTKATITGNLTVGNISATGISGTLSNGNSNIAIAANGNVSVSATGAANVLVVTGTGANIAGTANITGNANVGNIGAAQVLASANITAPQLISNVSTGTAPLVVSSTTQVANLHSATAGTATNLSAASSILAGSLSISPAQINKTAVATQTFTLTGLTTNHKIVITCGTSLVFGVFIKAAWASAANTLSIEFENDTGGNVTPPTLNIQYFAWV
jgi:hypothetical protein